MANILQFKNNFYIFLLTLLFLFEIYNCAVYLPFKILYLDDNIENFNSSDMIKYWKEPKIYSDLMIGTPSKRISVIFTSNIYELNLFQNMCDFEGSSYNKEDSSTYKYASNINYIYNKILNCSIINETIYFYTDQQQNSKIKFEQMNIIYSDNKKEEFKPDSGNKKEYEYHPNTCLNIGFRAQQSIGFGYDLNFVGQLKHYKNNNNSFIKSYDWTFKFTSDKEGYLIIGEKPHEFDKNNFKEEQYLLTGSKSSSFTQDWFLEVSSIYYFLLFQYNK